MAGVDPSLPSRRPSRRGLMVAAGGALGLAGVALLGVGVWEGLLAGKLPASASADLDRSPLLGQPAPALNVPGPSGQPVSLAALRGRPVLLNFWATWCTPCKEELPLLQRFSGEQHGRWAVLGLDELESADAVQSFARSLGITYALALDRDGSVSQRYLVQGLPTTFVLDAQGTIRAVHLGPLTSETLADYTRRV